MVNNLFYKILDMSLGAVPVILAIIILRFIFRGAPKNIRILMWAIAAFKLSFPYSIESRFSVLPESTATYAGVQSQIINSEAVFVDLSQTAGNSFSFRALCPYIWLAGIFVLLVYAAVGYIKLKERTRVSLKLKSNIYLCDYISTAFILGLFRPRIYIPSDTESAQIRYISAHERAHIARFDHVWKVIAYAVLLLHWFNPIVWISYVLFCRDLELCCDERVIKNMGAAEIKEYTNALLISSLPHRNILDCPLAFAELGVKERIKEILNYKKPGVWVIALSIIACIIAAVLFATVPEKKDVKLIEQSTESVNQTSAAQASTEVLSENNTALPAPGSGGGKQLIDNGQNYIKVDYLGEGVVTYTVLSARTAENINDMDRCLLISFEIRNESVSKEFYENHIALANCFNLSDGSPWDNQNRFFAEPKYLDLAESKPTKDNKLYFRYDFPKTGESTMFTLGFDLSNEVRDLLKEDKLYLSYTLDEINIPLRISLEDEELDGYNINSKMGILYLPMEGLRIKGLQEDIDLFLNAETKEEKEEILEYLISNPDNIITEIEKRDPPSEGGEAEEVRGN